MKIATHVDLSQAVAEALKWPGDIKLLARNAGYPDQVRSIAIEGIGCYLFGHNLASLTHFCRPIVTEERVTYSGYCWKSDRSVPGIELTDRAVQPHPEAWGKPILIDTFQQHEPLTELVATLTNPQTKGTIAADDITYPTAAIMAAWAEDCASKLPKELKLEDRLEAVTILTGWTLHWIEDCTVPHHAECLMLDGHSEYEGQAEEMWRKARLTGKADAWIKEAVTAAHDPARALRTIAEENALKSQCSPSRLCWYRRFRRGKWNDMIEASLRRSLCSAVEGVRRMRTYLD